VSESWVINASPVILLAKAGLVERISALANPLVIPEPVAAESFRGREDAAARRVKGDRRRFVQASDHIGDALLRGALQRAGELS
jgi:hypothetical protein